ncbi:hypothetical protein GW7_09373 [Heterocephalus glaber]|uniref:Uncharacterized protein n=1 Tax=Heterocephalus glaber TaxID=10181 RepID=G5ALV5_HETGA|nr:hypothetical protein GW7_09373 [Heterocephalus glaber]
MVSIAVKKECVFTQDKKSYSDEVFLSPKLQTIPDLWQIKCIIEKAEILTCKTPMSCRLLRVGIFDSPHLEHYHEMSNLPLDALCHEVSDLKQA